MHISPLNIDFKSEIILPRSKSESNRALMIMHYAGIQNFMNSGAHKFNFFESSLSTSDDTILLQKHLNTINQYLQTTTSDIQCPKVIELDCANAGTVLRFLMTAVANLQLANNNSQLDFLLTGSDRMKERPIKPLVDALRTLGVSIEYLEKESYPPVLIKAGEILGGELEISVDQSSQFVSSLILAAPLWKNGLSLNLKGNLVSLPYIDMTINMMKNAGIDVVRDDRNIIVRHSKYNLENLIIEPDWSAAAFWYEILALSEKSQIFFKDLNIDSLQADAVIKDVFKNLGVETLPMDDGVMIRKTGVIEKFITFDFTNSPDVFPAVIAACAGLQVDADFYGLKNLSIKESDRKKAMMAELSKVNIYFEEVSEDILKMRCCEDLPCFAEDEAVTFENYKDHRIAMALVPLAMKVGHVKMENTDVVSKSYPDFFKDYKI